MLEKLENIGKVVKELIHNRAVCVPVESSNIICWTYTPQTKQLAILFGADRNTHSTYKYKNVGLDVVFKLLLADSVGQEFRKSILNKYEFTRLNADGSVKYTGK